jgi:DNA-directed RNA polymerase alpha subunit
MKKEEVDYLAQLVQSLEEAVLKLESSYNQKDAESFNKIKRFILDIQNRTSEVTG